MASFHVSIITPQGEVFSGEIDSLVAPGEEGYLGVMANHAPMIAALQRGALVTRVDDAVAYFAVGHGVLEVATNQVLVLVDDAVPADSLETAAAQARTMSV